MAEKSPTNGGHFKMLISLGRVSSKAYFLSILALGSIMGGRSIPPFSSKFVKFKTPKIKNRANRSLREVSPKTQTINSIYFLFQLLYLH